MLLNLHYLLVICTSLVNICTAIRVDWNTNKGPIIPPTPRPSVRSQPLLREPAPVWEDLSDDIPNRNPYTYLIPPPLQPRSRLHTRVDYKLSSKGNNYGILVPPQNAYDYYQQTQNSTEVASLAAEHIPNVGLKYVAVVTKPTPATKSTISPLTALSADDKNAYKTQGKYNIKTKKYKAYQKVKYVPNNNYSTMQKEKQQLPSKEKTQNWSAPAFKDSKPITTTTTISTKSYAKQINSKDVKDKSKYYSSAFVDNVRKS